MILTVYRTLVLQLSEVLQYIVYAMRMCRC